MAFEQALANTKFLGLHSRKLVLNVKTHSSVTAGMAAAAAAARRGRRRQWRLVGASLVCSPAGVFIQAFISSLHC